MEAQLQNDYNTAKNIGSQFLQTFFGKGPVNYANFYGNDSVLSFESEVHFGQQNIAEKLSSLNLISDFKNYEVQPSVGGILIFVSGSCCISGETNQIPFTRVMFLAHSNGSYYVKNDIYKITLG